MAFEACSECCRRTLNRKEQLRHRAVSLRQHGFLVSECDCRLDTRDMTDPTKVGCHQNGFDSYYEATYL